MLDRYQRVGHGAHIGVKRECLPPSVDPPNDGIFDWNDARIRLAVVHGPNGTTKCRERNVLDRMSPDLRDRGLGVRAVIALECDAHGQICSALRGSVWFGSVLRL
jgi:hypothetical protein